jgi:hypothetical protein
MGRNRWDIGGRQDPRRGARVENLALVPASLLPHKATYQRLANQLPTGAVLVVLPTEDTPERRGLQEAAARLRAKGHAIATLTVEEVLAQAGRRRVARPTNTTPPIDAPPTAPPVDQPPPPAAADLTVAAEASRPAAAVVPPFLQELRLVRIDTGSGPARFEIYQWQPTLWGGVALVRLRGALGQPPRVQTLLEAATPAPSDALVAQVHRRLRAGYRIADWQ